MNRRKLFSLLAAVPLAAIAPKTVSLSARVHELMARMWAKHYALQFETFGSFRIATPDVSKAMWAKVARIEARKAAVRAGKAADQLSWARRAEANLRRASAWNSWNC